MTNIQGYKLGSPYERQDLMRTIFIPNKFALTFLCGYGRGKIVEFDWDSNTTF